MEISVRNSYYNLPSWMIPNYDDIDIDVDKRKEYLEALRTNPNVRTTEEAVQDESFANRVLQHTTYISFQDFCQHLTRCVNAFIDVITGKKNATLFTIFIVDNVVDVDKDKNKVQTSCKSGVWALLLACMLAPKFSSSGHGTVVRVFPTTYTIWGKSTSSVLNNKNSNNNNTIAFIDDGMFTGNQMCKRVYEAVKHYNQCRTKLSFVQDASDVQVHIICPVVSRLAILRIMLAVDFAIIGFDFDDLEAEVDRYIYDGTKHNADDLQLMLSLKRISTPQHCTELYRQQTKYRRYYPVQRDQLYIHFGVIIEDMSTLSNETWNHQLFPVYFQHKIPDDASSFPQVYSGYVPHLSQLCSPLRHFPLLTSVSSFQDAISVQPTESGLEAPFPIPPYRTKTFMQQVDPILHEDSLCAWGSFCMMQQQQE